MAFIHKTPERYRHGLLEYVWSIGVRFFSKIAECFKSFFQEEKIEYRIIKIYYYVDNSYGMKLKSTAIVYQNLNTGEIGEEHFYGKDIPKDACILWVQKNFGEIVEFTNN